MKPFQQSQIQSKLVLIQKSLERYFKHSPLFIKYPNKLLSLSIIGRSISERRIDKLMDIDILVIISDPISAYVIKEIQRIFNRLKKLSSEDICVSYKIADGPIKPSSKKLFNIFLHVLLHTKKSYINSPLVLVKYSWQNEATAIQGCSIKKIQSIKSISLDELVNGKLGIRHCKSLIITESSACLIWKKSKNHLELKLVPIKFKSLNEKVEICIYSVLRCASNTLKYLSKNHKKHFGIEERDMVLFRKTFKKHKICDLPLKYYRKKNSIRTGKWIPSDIELYTIKKKSIDFLTKLEEILFDGHR